MELDNICRLCFSVSNQNSCKLSEESGILRKIYLCICLPISLDENLPSSICSDCLNKIEEMLYFKAKVTQNQNTLYQHLNNGINNLEKFYLSLNVGFKVKEEIKEIEVPVVEHVLNLTFKNEPCEKETVIKQEKTDFDEKFNNISDEIETLPSVKAKKVKSIIKNKINKPSKTKLKFKKSSVSVKCATESTAKKNSKTKAKENSNTAKDGTPVNENLDKTKDHKKTDAIFKCLTCFKVLESRRVLVQHYRKEHGENAAIEEDLKDCFSETKKKGIATYKCGKCDKEFILKNVVQRHMYAHSQIRPFMCNICGRGFKLPGEIVLHGQIHDHESTERYKCVYKTCSYSTNSMIAVKDHERRHAEDENRDTDKLKFNYKCDQCGKGFRIRSHFEEHENVHKGIRPFVCDICGKTFDATRYLKYHRRMFHPQAAQLKRWTCKHCSLPFSSRRTLKTHMKRHGGQNYLCDTCGKSLTGSESYQAHRRLHLDEKPFKCSHCDKSFANKKYLVGHEVTHTGERKYECKECGKRYTQRTTLVKHMRQHEGGWEESLECSKCQRKFEYRSQVVSHEKVCGNNEELTA